MITLGLTGGIASGKSTVAARLRQLGAAIIDADAITRDLVRPGSPALAAIVERFGPTVLGGDGALDRATLGNIVFADSDARKDLEAILHPRIWKAALAERDRLERIGYHVVFYEAALLVETGTYKQLDGLIVVSAPTDVQQRRLVARDGHSLTQARARIEAQLPLHDKIKVAGWHLDNAGTEADLIASVDRLVKVLESEFGPLTIAAAPARPRRGTVNAPLVARYAPVLSDQYAALVIGAPNPIALSCAAHLAAPERAAVWLLVPPAALPAVEQWQQTSPVSARVTLLVGNPTHIHLGLASDEYRELCGRLTSIVVIDEDGDNEAPQASLTASLAVARHAIGLAKQAAALDHLTYLSSAFVAGTTAGPFLETMPPAAGPFLFDYDHRKAQVERTYAAMRAQLPIVIARASAALALAEADVEPSEQLAGNRLLTWLQRFPHVPLPVAPDAYVHVVDVHYLGEALAALSRHRHAAGKTVHLVADPLAIRTFAAITRHPVPDGLAQHLMPWLHQLLRQPTVARFAALLSRKALPSALRPLRLAMYHQQQANALLGPLGIKSRRAEDLVVATLK